ncbi:PREDICTED: serine protease gd-like isoform X2 [Vollenhovia emeryi]|nr:PREDICTED: serine protease gd-like isoform X2 [Vollenhovia emeryi]
MLYHNFPVTVNFPIVSAIWFNYQQYCHGPGGSSGSFVANIALGHMVYPPNKEPLSQDFQSWHRNTSRYRINNPVFYSSTECGVANYDTEGKNKRLIFDETSSPGQWPWIVAVYHVEIEELETTYSFKCGGFLFTNRHVLTAAHCLKMDLLSNDTIDPNRLQVAMGLLSWGKLHGDGTVNRNVTIYKIHPNYEHNTHGDSDVAILTLSDLVEFNPFIKPICLWSGFNLINPVDLINRTGYIVGWGEDSTSFGSIVERQPVPAKIVSQETCLKADRIYRNLISDNTFCAGLLDRQGPCNSGSGLLFLNTLTGRYELRGIVSRSLFTISKTPSCNLGNYVVYVDLVKYVYWIHQQLY